MYFTVRLKKRVCFALACCILAICGAVYATASAVLKEQVALPVIMYHSILKDPKYQGKYVISPEDFEADLRYLKENGYTAVGAKELLAYVREGTPLPEKPVVLTFDDGYYNNYMYAFPLAQEYGMKFILSPIGTYSDQYTGEEKLSGYYSHATWPQIREMQESGLVEIGNHTYNLHKSDGPRLGAKQLPGESDTDYAALLTKDVNAMQEKLLEHTGRKADIFVFPFGAISESAPALIKEMGFPVSFSCEEKVNTISRDPESLQLLCRFLRTNTRTVRQILE